MRLIFTVLLLLISVKVFALDVTISTKTDNTDKPVITGTTNLPDGIELMITLERNESNFMAQDKVTVRGVHSKQVHFLKREQA